VVSSPAIGSNGLIYFGCFDKRLYTVNLTGNQVWRYFTQNPITSSPGIGADGTVYVGSGDGFVYSFNGLTGTLVLWSGASTHQDLSLVRLPLAPQVRSTSSPTTIISTL
jgi:outer membrane protein assembly factor BamB